MCAQGHPVGLFAVVTLSLLSYYYYIGHYDITLICYSLNFSDIIQGYIMGTAWLPQKWFFLLRNLFFALSLGV